MKKLRGDIGREEKRIRSIGGVVFSGKMATIIGGDEWRGGSRVLRQQSRRLKQ